MAVLFNHSVSLCHLVWEVKPLIFQITIERDSNFFHFVDTVVSMDLLFLFCLMILMSFILPPIAF